MRKRQHYKVGAIVKIDLGDGFSSYARLLEVPLIGFYDIYTDKDLPIDEIVSKPILFKVWVMKYAVSSCRWPKVGYQPLEAELKELPVFFRQDELQPSFFFLYYMGGREVRTTREQCEHLERAAVWEPEHVEERLRDHFAGRPNRWVESLRPQPA